MGPRIPESYKREIAKNFKAKRISMGLQQIDVAARGGFNSKLISMIERAGGYSVARLVKACDAMGVTLKDVCNGNLQGVETIVKNYPTPTKTRTNLNVTRDKNKDWSITMGEWRLTLSGIKEPDAILLEKI